MVYIYLTGYISLFVYPFKVVVYLCLPVYLTALSLCLSISLPWPWNRKWGDSASELYSCVSLYSNDSTGPVNRPTDIPTGRQQEISAYKLYCRQQNNYTVYPIGIPNIYKYVQYLNNLLLYRTAKVRNQLLASRSLYVQSSPIITAMLGGGYCSDMKKGKRTILFLCTASRRALPLLYMEYTVQQPTLYICM
jgi:hypothetical protein